MISSPKVSVIIPTYNRKAFLTTAIASVLQQTESDVKIIVVDDASTDGTADWLQETYPMVQVLQLPQNSGCAKARNTAIKVAKGEFLAFLDSDDQWLPTYLEQQLQALQAAPENVLVCCDFLDVRQAGKSAQRSSGRNPLYADLTEHLLMDNFIGTMSIVVIRKDVLQQSGLFNETLPNCSDREMYLRLSHVGQFAYVPQILVHRVLHTTNLVGNHRQWAMSALRVISLFFADPRSQAYRHLKGKIRSNLMLMIARDARAKGKCDRTFQLMRLTKALWYSPTYTMSKFWAKFS
jgi:glycosyltransferase involved in cell wall biosynthesis